MTRKESLDLNWKSFISWLKLKDVYHNFKLNHDNCEKIKDYYFKNTLKETVKPSLWVRYGFIWDDTKEGNEFWFKINNEWNSFIKNNKSIIISNKQYDRIFIKKLWLDIS